MSHLPVLCPICPVLCPVCLVPLAGSIKSGLDVRLSIFELSIEAGSGREGRTHTYHADFSLQSILTIHAGSTHSHTLLTQHTIHTQRCRGAEGSKSLPLQGVKQKARGGRNTLHSTHQTTVDCPKKKPSQRTDNYYSYNNTNHKPR